MRHSGPEQLALKDQTKFDVLLNVEVLSGCARECTGCFINKNHPASASEALLAHTHKLADDVKRVGLNLRELVLGPTDFFTASNIEDVLMSPHTQAIMAEHLKARIAVPAKFDLVSMERLREIYSILDNPDNYRDGMLLEFVMPVELPDTMINDKEYFNKVMEKIKFFEEETNKDTDWSFTLQSSAILGRKISKEQYNQMLNKVVKDYGTILEMNPAFARAPIHKQKENLESWNNFLSEVITDDNKDIATMSMANLYCNSMNFIGLTVLMGRDGPETHLNIMLHEQAFFPTNDRTNVTGLSFEEILDRRDELIMRGLRRADEVSDCMDCNYQVACANRLVFEAMDFMKIEGCVLPKDVLDKFNPTEQGDHLWNEEALMYMNKSSSEVRAA
jgi:hypothetical protein